MGDYKIRQIFEQSYEEYSAQGHFQSDVQRKAVRAILNCKSGRLGVNLSQCTDCGHLEIHNNSCRNRNCPNCQAVLKEIWVDKRRAEVIDSPYFHVVFTLPHELNPLIYCNQKLLYSLLHRCCAETLLELSSDKKWLGATPGISRFSTLGIRNWIIMYTCTALFPVAGLPKMEKSANLPQIFLSARKSCGINSKGNIWHIFPLFTKAVLLLFPLPVKSCVIPITGRSGRTSFMKWTGVLTSRKPLTALAMLSNTLVVIPTRLPFPTAGYFLLQRIR